MSLRYQTYAREIVRMENTDRQTRQRLMDSGELFNRYNEEMEKVHTQSARRLKAIISQIGWPIEQKVGQRAHRAALMIVQHAISMPDFQRYCLGQIKRAIEEGAENKRNYAFLYDRICFNERRAQKFGTQFDWDENGLMSPWKIEDPENVHQLRREYGLNSLEEQTRLIRQRLKESGEKPPRNYQERQKEIHEWSREKGWIE